VKLSFAVALFEPFTANAWRVYSVFGWRLPMVALLAVTFEPLLMMLSAVASAVPTTQ
jgi:hypothetical protein